MKVEYKKYQITPEGDFVLIEEGTVKKGMSESDLNLGNLLGMKIE